MMPLFLDLMGRLVVVVGGGPVGRRRARSVLAAGARVRVIDLLPAPADDPAAGADWVAEPYRLDHLEGAALVFTCGPADLNQQVAADARARGLWCNRADAAEAGDLIVPACVRRGDLVVAISTGGAAPSLARRLRHRLERALDEAYGQWIALLAELRPVIRAAIADPARRRQVHEHLSRPRWLRRLRRHGPEAVRAAMLARVRALAGPAAPDV